MGLILGSGRSPWVGNGDTLKNSYLDNFMDRGAWQAIAHGVKKSQTLLSRHITHAGGMSIPSSQFIPSFFPPVIYYDFFVNYTSTNLERKQES